MAISLSSSERKKNNINNANRGRIQIMADILYLCTVEIKKTHIMYKANLSFEQINYYLTDLLNIELISQHISNSSTIYRTTEKGREYLRYYYLLMELLKEGQQPDLRQEKCFPLLT